MKKWYDFVARELPKYVTTKETWGGDIGNEPDAIKLDTRLEPQIEYLYSILPDDSKTTCFEDAESTREEYGMRYIRSSENYAIVFARKVMMYTLTDGYDDTFRVHAEAHWDGFKNNVFPYNPTTGKTLKFVKFLGISPDQKVFLVKDDDANTNWVIKWESNDTRQLANAESLEYTKLESLGATVPKRLDGFKFMEFPILVIELLQPLDVTDNPLEMARQLLVTQLKYIHTYACYLDLKTDNIKKRASNPPVYFIIDMNLSERPIAGGGFKRLHWTPLFASQTFPPEESMDIPVSSYYDDLVELGYVIHQMIARRSYLAKWGVFKDNRGLNAIGLIPGDFFADPETMFKDPSINQTRFWRAARKMLEYPLADTKYITADYMRYVSMLPRRFPPATVHEQVAQTLFARIGSYADFVETTQKSLEINCQICGDIATSRCGECYQKTTFLCSNMCAVKHACK